MPPPPLQLHASTRQSNSAVGTHSANITRRPTENERFLTDRPRPSFFSPSLLALFIPLSLPPSLPLPRFPHLSGIVEMIIDKFFPSSSPLSISLSQFMTDNARRRPKEGRTGGPEERQSAPCNVRCVCFASLHPERERERERERSVLWVRFRGKTYFVYLPKHSVFQWLRNE